MLNSAMLRMLSSDWNAEQSLAMLMIKHLNATKATNIIKGGKKDKGNYYTDKKRTKPRALELLHVSFSQTLTYICLRFYEMEKY